VWFSDMAETFMSLKNVLLQAYPIKSVNTRKANKDGWKRFKLSHALKSLLWEKITMARTTCLQDIERKFDVFAYLTIQQPSSLSKWLPIDVCNREINQLLIQAFRDLSI